MAAGRCGSPADRGEHPGATRAGPVSGLRRRPDRRLRRRPDELRPDPGRPLGQHRIPGRTAAAPGPSAGCPTPPVERIRVPRQAHRRRGVRQGGRRPRAGPELPDSAPRATAILLGQYLSAIGILTAAEEQELHLQMVAGAVAAGFRTLVFKPHPSLPESDQPPAGAAGPPAGGRTDRAGHARTGGELVPLGADRSGRRLVQHRPDDCQVALRSARSPGRHPLGPATPPARTRTATGSLRSPSTRRCRIWPIALRTPAPTRSRSPGRNSTPCCGRSGTACSRSGTRNCGRTSRSRWPDGGGRCSGMLSRRRLTELNLPGRLLEPRHPRNRIVYRMVGARRYRRLRRLWWQLGSLLSPGSGPRDGAAGARGGSASAELG